METNSTIISEFALSRRPTFLKVNLDIISDNLKILKRNLSMHTEFIAVVKANAYGHGSTVVSRFLEKQKITHFAVATALEGEELRAAGVLSEIQVLGNATDEEIPTLSANRLIPTVADKRFLKQWLRYGRQDHGNEILEKNIKMSPGCVVIKIDTGMSRNGCQLDEVNDILQFCEDNGIQVHSIMTHFAESWTDPVFTGKQLNVFLQAVLPYREQGIKIHVANSGAIINKVGVDMDYARPGISMYGQAPDYSEFGISTTTKLGLKPAISWYGKATMIHKFAPGRVVGYNKTYTTTGNEIIAVIPVGYADGYLRNMFGKGFVTTSNGINCPVVGQVSMDAITVKLPDGAHNCTEFCLMPADYNNVNSSVAIARKTDTTPYEVCTNLDRRIPRLYETCGQISLNI